MPTKIVHADELLPDGSEPEPLPPTPPPSLPTKPWWESRTVWVGVITTVVAVLSLVTETFELSENAASALLFLVAVLNIVLRAVTTTALSTGRPSLPSAE